MYMDMYPLLGPFVMLPVWFGPVLLAPDSGEDKRNSKQFLIKCSGRHTCTLFC